jgi:hypothetical protein
MIIVLSDEGLNTGSATDGETSAVTIFDDDKALLFVYVKRGRLVYFLLLNNALNLEETVNRIFEGGAALGVRVHLKDEIGGRNLIS